MDVLLPRRPKISSEYHTDQRFYISWIIHCQLYLCCNRNATRELFSFDGRINDIGSGGRMYNVCSLYKVRLHNFLSTHRRPNNRIAMFIRNTYVHKLTNSPSNILWSWSLAIRNLYRSWYSINCWGSIGIAINWWILFRSNVIVHWHYFNVFVHFTAFRFGKL